MLKFPPIKYKPIPQRLIYKNGDRYTMFSTNDGKKLVNMIVEERFYGKRKDEKYEFYPKKEKIKRIFILLFQILVLPLPGKMCKRVRFIRSERSKWKRKKQIHSVYFSARYG